MGTYTILMPDVGEGIAEAELAEILVPVGDELREDDVFAAVMTDKATVEIPSAVSGKVVWYAGAEGDTIAIGAPLVKIEVDGPGNEGEIAVADMAQLTPGNYALTVTVTDDMGLAGSATITVDVVGDELFADGFEDPVP